MSIVWVRSNKFSFFIKLLLAICLIVSDANTDAKNKDNKYQEKKKAKEQLKELLKKHNKKLLIDIINKEREDKWDHVLTLMMLI